MVALPQHVVQFGRQGHSNARQPFGPCKLLRPLVWRERIMRDGLARPLRLNHETRGRIAQAMQPQRLTSKVEVLFALPLIASLARRIRQRSRLVQGRGPRCPTLTREAGYRVPVFQLPSTPGLPSVKCAVCRAMRSARSRKALPSLMNSSSVRRSGHHSAQSFDRSPAHANPSASHQHSAAQHADNRAIKRRVSLTTISPFSRVRDLPYLPTVKARCLGVAQSS